ncbi:unnamed protein product [Penicillium salamii]|nr:unnamed protein product [Penicillium salamii]CAG8305828.1 unnamed protein product [Penicillium salamii]
MRASILFTLTALAGIGSARSGCGKAIPDGFPSAGSSQTLSLPNSNRTYRIHIPSTYEQNTKTPEGLSQFSNPEFNPDGIAVYPNTDNGVWLSNQLAHTSHPNDLDFTDQLLTHLEENLCVDERRIYANGKSNGGELTAVIACNATVGSRFAAFSVVSDAWHETGDVPGVGACEPAKRNEGYPFLIFHGTVDQIAPINGDIEDEIVPIIDFLHNWAERNGCDKDQKWARNITVHEDPLVKRAGWDCDGKKNIVEFYREGDNGHCWPCTHSNDDYATMGPEKCPMGHYVFNATEIIFNFYSRYQLNSQFQLEM